MNKNDNIKIQKENTLRTSESVIRYLLFINGGAVLSLLTFIGNTEKSYQYMPEALLMFSVGIFFAVLSAGSSFFAQRHYLLHAISPKRGKNAPKITKRSIRLAIISYISFFIGVVLSYSAFIS